MNLKPVAFSDWKFLVGPKGNEEQDIVDIQDALDSSDFSKTIRSYIPHPFIPTISTRSVRENLNGLAPGFNN